MTKFRVSTSSCGGVKTYTDYEDYREAMDRYSAVFRNAGTGESVEFYEVDDRGKSRLIITDVSPADYEQNAEPRPKVEQMSMERGHRCHWDYRGKCIRCGKPRPFWA